MYGRRASRRPTIRTSDVLPVAASATAVITSTVTRPLEQTVQSERIAEVLLAAPFVHPAQPLPRRGEDGLGDARAGRERRHRATYVCRACLMTKCSRAFALATVACIAVFALACAARAAATACSKAALSAVAELPCMRASQYASAAIATLRTQVLAHRAACRVDASS